VSGGFRSPEDDSQNQQLDSQVLYGLMRD